MVLFSIHYYAKCFCSNVRVFPIFSLAQSCIKDISKI